MRYPPNHFNDSSSPSQHYFHQITGALSVVKSITVHDKGHVNSSITVYISTPGKTAPSSVSRSHHLPPIFRDAIEHGSANCAALSPSVEPSLCPHAAAYLKRDASRPMPPSRLGDDNNIAGQPSSDRPAA